MISIILFNSFFSFAQSKKINWMTFSEAIEAQKKAPKKILMDVYTTWCGPCKLMDKNTFGNPDIIRIINENYYAVKFNAEGNSTVNYKGKDYKNPGYVEGKYGRNSSHNFTRYLGVYAYPTIVFFDDNTNPIAPITGYLTPQQIEIYLSLFREKKYLEVKSQEDFKKFISEHESVL